MFNALFVLIVFMLTLHKDTLYINWPFGVKENITYTEDEHVRIYVDNIDLIYMFKPQSLFIFPTHHNNFLSDSGHKRIPSLRTHWYRVSILLLSHYRYSIHCYVVPSIRYIVTHIGFNRTQLLQPQE